VRIRLRLPSRISARLLLFNILLVFLPVAGFLYLGVYERQLLHDQERSMVQQGRLLAAALAGQPALDAASAGDLLRRLEGRTEARLRIFSPDGVLLADSSRLGPRKPDEPVLRDSSQARDNLLYQGAATAYRVWRFLRSGQSTPVRGYMGRYPSQDLPSSSKAVRSALAGRYGAAVGTTGGEIWRPSLTLQSALPVRDGKAAVVGAVLVSQSTVRILRELDEVRLNIVKVFLISVGVAAILSLLLAGTITHPIRRLRDEASDLLDRRGRLRGRFGGSRRADEIGDLARALEELTHRLAAHQHAVESFASDVSHELKNPLASVRSAAELLADIDDPADRERFLALAQREVTRMERLLTAVREIGEIDARLETEPPEPVDLDALLREVVEGFRRRADNRGNREIRFVAPGGPVHVRARAERLFQVFENLLDNALGFSPAGATVTVTLARVSGGGGGAVRIEDQGPGIPESHRDRIFDRFFTYRPDEPHARDGHTGLGLAIVKAIVEGYGGTVAAENLEGGGARVEVRLPA
jgi:two-component system sensor histidine kinase ChvG